MKKHSSNSSVVHSLGSEHENLCFQGIADSTEDIQVFNECTLEGSITVKTLHTELLKLQGQFSADTLQAKNASCIGTLTIAKAIRSENLHLNGSIHSLSMSLGKLSGIGIVTATEDIDCKELDYIGSIRAKNIRSQSFTLGGAVNAQHLEAQRVSLMLRKDTPSSLDTLHAETVVIKAKHTSAAININSLQAKKIKVENVHAEMLSGDVVIIGQGCKIREVRAAVNL